MKRYHTILFDLDGTLTDPQEGITKSVQYALAKFGIEVTDRRTLLPFIGPPLTYSFHHFHGLTEEESIEAVGYYREYFERGGMLDNAVFDGMAELLAALKREGKTLLVATSKPTIYAKPILEHFGLAEYFTEIVGATLDGTRSEKGDVIEEALRYTTDAKEDILMVGDRKHDVIGARQNGIDIAAVGFGYGTDEERAAYPADYYAATVEDLAKLLLG